MCYRCHFCDRVSQPKQQMLRYVTYAEVSARDRIKRIVIGQDFRGRNVTREVVDGQTRVGKRILTEVPVCKECKQWLDIGASESDLRRHLLLNGRAKDQKMEVVKERGIEVKRPSIPLVPLRPTVVEF